MEGNKINTSWNLAPLFASDNDPEIQKQRNKIEEENNKFITKWKEKSEYLLNPLTLKEALDDYEKLIRNYGTGGVEEYYFWLRSMQDQIDPVLKAKFAKISDFSIKLRNELQFFELSLAKIPNEKQKIFLESKILEDYRYFLKKIFNRAKYILSDNEEKIINLKAEPAYQRWVMMLSSFLSKEEREVFMEEGKKEKKNLEQLLSLISSKNKKIRDSAALALNDILDKNTDIAESELNAILANKKIDDGLRKMQRPDFSRHLDDDIETEIVDKLINEVSKRFDISERFYQLKAQLLGVKVLEYHERNVELGKIDKSYVFDEGVKLILRVLNKLDKEFKDIFLKFIAGNQIDVFPAKGKRGGAFCSYWLLSLPTYILLNYSNKLRDVTTLAHELGHGINNELMKKKQNALNFGTPMATAEVASTFMEDFVLQEIMSDVNEEEKLEIIMARLNDEVSTIFRQIACYKFELELHRNFRDKGYLPKKDIGKIFQKNMSLYMGKGVSQSKGSENWWVYWSHIRSYFYVYSYALGLIISKSLQNSVKKNPQFIIKVKEFLSAGLSESPKKIFMNLGIDIYDSEFWINGLNEIESQLNEAEYLAKKLNKI